MGLNLTVLREVFIDVTPTWFPALSGVPVSTLRVAGAFILISQHSSVLRVLAVVLSWRGLGDSFWLLSDKVGSTSRLVGELTEISQLSEDPDLAVLRDMLAVVWLV